MPKMQLDQVLKRGIFVFLCQFTIISNQLFGLECKDIKQMTKYYLSAHFSIHDFNEEISKRTVNNFVKMWDPGKVFFLKEDVEKFNKSAYSSLPSMIERTNCSLIDVLFALYSKRYKERQKLVLKLIDSKHDFNKDEYLTINRKTLPYASSLQEIEERWRKRVKFQHLQLKKTLDEDDKIKEKLRKRYELAFKRHKDLTTEDVYGTFMDSFANALDPHTDYFSPSQLEEFRISTRLSLEGIGALLRSEDGVTSIQSLVPGGAAQKTGKVKVGDKIVSVGQGKATPVDVIDMDLKDVVKLIRGPGGSEVRLYVRRGDKEVVIPIVREKIQLADRAAKSQIYESSVMVKNKMKQYKIGVIDLPSFYMDFEGRQANKENFRSSSRDMAKEINKLKKEKVNAIIVDLRSNGGGSLDEAINVAGLFVGAGPIVQIKGSQEKPFISSYDQNQIYRGPLVVMIDKQSASASEIFAGAIKDYGRGIVIGDTHTFGKGTVQNLNDLSQRLGAIKITISKFFRPSGKSTQLLGVASDVKIPSISDVYEIGEEHYDYAIPWEKVGTTKYRKFGLVKPYLSKIINASEKRISANKDFKEIKEVIKKYNSEKEEREKVSLKLDKNKDNDTGKETVEDENLQKDAYGNVLNSLENDVYLREAVNIATDYIRVLNKQKLLAISLPSLEVATKKKPLKDKTNIKKQ